MLSLTAYPESVERTPLPMLLERVGTELGSLSASVDDLQDQLGAVLARVAEDAPHAIVHVQTLDVLAQTLASLAGFMQALGPQTGGARPIDIEPLVEALTLSDLAARLRGQAETEAADEFELF